MKNYNSKREELEEEDQATCRNRKRKTNDAPLEYRKQKIKENAVKE